MNKKIILFLLPLVAFLVLGALGFSIRSPMIRRSESRHNIPDTPETKEIMKTIERAYDIKAEAAYTFDLKKLPTVFINDPRFPLNEKDLETVRQLTYNPSLESVGWLDYEIAHYSWWRDAVLHSEAVHAKAKAENRDLTQEERKSLVDPYGRVAPARVESPIRKISLTFLSVEVDQDIAIVDLDDGPRTIQMTLVLVDKKWYIANSKILSIHP
jgi:hypothetical protein